MRLFVHHNGLLISASHRLLYAAPSVAMRIYARACSSHLSAASTIRISYVRSAVSSAVLHRHHLSIFSYAKHVALRRRRIAAAPEASSILASATR